MSKCDVPTGTRPLMISMREMEALGLKTGKGLRDTVTHKVLEKEVILSEIAHVGFLCPFYPIRDELKKLEGEDVLVIADSHEKYGENWIVCLTRPSFEEMIRGFLIVEEDVETTGASDTKEEIVYVYEDRPIIAKAWESPSIHETYEQVNALDIHRKRSLIRLSLCKMSDEMELEYRFTDRNAEHCFVEFRPHRDQTVELFRLEQDIGLQGTPMMTDDATQTSWFRSINSALQYEPITMTKEEKTCELNSEKMLVFLRNTLPIVEQVLQQNETLDIFLDPFSCLHAEDVNAMGKDENCIREIRSFTDLVYSKNKTIAAIDWHPQKPGIVAVAAASNCNLAKRYDDLENTENSYVLIWNFSDLIHPQMMLEAPQDVEALRYNSMNPHIIAGGLHNGQIVLWDTSKVDAMESVVKGEHEESRKKTPVVKPIHLSYIDGSHRRPVRELLWLPNGREVTPQGHVIPSESMNQFITIAGDGQVCFWDLRFEDTKYRNASRRKNLKESSEIQFVPIYAIALIKMEGPGELELRCFCLEKPLDELDLASCSQFYCVTEEGELYNVDWRPFAALGKHTAIESASKDVRGSEGAIEHIKWLHEDHCRPTISLSISPFFPVIILTASEACFHIWNTKSESRPIFISSLCTSAITCATFSPTRPAVVFVGRSDGVVEVWDFLDQSHAMSLSAGISACSLTCIEFRPVMARSLIDKSVEIKSKANGLPVTQSSVLHSVGKDQLVAIGDHNGNLHILEIPSALSRPFVNEMAMMDAFFQRESERLKAHGGNVSISSRHIKILDKALDAANLMERSDGEDEVQLQRTDPAEELHSLMEEDLFRQIEVEFRNELQI
uniref:Uncharacterized protein AlNc14C151G7534 n=1 Tax=Albugo laibachii Nc14 TaxID=890382 RepID=F0WM23_9STRA|nr:conserved hypothetical protein [Albugo laibachii Nc14]|eukprot:CCA22350.1 conserved hypothetical protein [Albugo laibachii Nc14]